MLYLVAVSATHPSLNTFTHISIYFPNKGPWLSSLPLSNPQGKCYELYGYAVLPTFLPRPILPVGSRDILAQLCTRLEKWTQWQHATHIQKDPNSKMTQLSAAPLVSDVGASTLQNKHGLL